MPIPFAARPPEGGVVKRRFRRVSYLHRRKCFACGKDFMAARLSAVCCTATCRKTMLRIKAKAAAEAERIIEEEEQKRFNAKMKPAKSAQAGRKPAKPAQARKMVTKHLVKRVKGKSS